MNFIKTQGTFVVKENMKIAADTFRLKIGDFDDYDPIPGQFLNIRLNGFFLRRPFSVCDFSTEARELSIIYKIFGNGTLELSKITKTQNLDILYGLGNGFQVQSVPTNANIALIGGGVGTAPLYYLAKKLIEFNHKYVTILGFKDSSQIFYINKFSKISEIHIATEDGSFGILGYVTDILEKLNYNYYFSCGPPAMLKAVHQLGHEGQICMESRMACGFGACMGCSCKILNNEITYKRICTEGPVFSSRELVF
ncbi:MAG: dihydroorotate dehydrogenase electron transfer subunit [Candidatus Improbicoccus devescovinae]|nr:MAG: dihydroorotate dehydrogenase electron transfer subunit [Candidatus Improbicoccus devescovinae]